MKQFFFKISAEDKYSREHYCKTYVEWPLKNRQHKNLNDKW